MGFIKSAVGFSPGWLSHAAQKANISEVDGAYT